MPNLKARRIYSAPTDWSSGVISDQSIMLSGYLSHRRYPNHLRLIRFTDTDASKTYVFVTNHTALPALTIYALYKSRWQIELFFK